MLRQMSLLMLNPDLHALAAFQWKLCTTQDPTVLTIANV